MNIESLYLNITLLIVILICYISDKIIKAISLYLICKKLNIGNKGLAFIPIYWNWVEIDVINQITKIRTLEIKVASIISPLILIAGNYLILSNPSRPEYTNIFLYIIYCQYAGVCLIQILLRMYAIRVSGGSDIVNILICIFMTDFWIIYELSLLNNIETEKETILLKRKSELDKNGIKVEWK